MLFRGAVQDLHQVGGVQPRGFTELLLLQLVLQELLQLHLRDAPVLLLRLSGSLGTKLGLIFYIFFLGGNEKKAKLGILFFFWGGRPKGTTPFWVGPTVDGCEIRFAPPRKPWFLMIPW